MIPDDPNQPSAHVTGEFQYAAVNSGGTLYSLPIDLVIVPEPGTVALFGLVAIAVGGKWKR